MVDTRCCDLFRQVNRRMSQRGFFTVSCGCCHYLLISLELITGVGSQHDLEIGLQICLLGIDESEVKARLFATLELTDAQVVIVGIELWRVLGTRLDGYGHCRLKGHQVEGIATTAHSHAIGFNLVNHVVRDKQRVVAIDLADSNRLRHLGITLGVQPYLWPLCCRRLFRHMNLQGCALSDHGEFFGWDIFRVAPVVGTRGVAPPNR